MHPFVLDYKIRNKQITIEHNFIKYFTQLHVSTALGHHQADFQNTLKKCTCFTVEVRHHFL